MGLGQMKGRTREEGDAGAERAGQAATTLRGRRMPASTQSESAFGCWEHSGFGRLWLGAVQSH